MTYEPPDYCKHTFDSVGDGFAFSAEPPPDLGDEKNLRSANPWEVLGCALVRLQVGDFAVFPAVVDALARHDDLLLALHVGELFAHAAPSAMGLLDRVYTPEQLEAHPELVRQYCRILCHSLVPGHLERVLYWYRRGRGVDAQASIPLYLSHVWEDEPREVHAGPQPDPDVPPEFAESVIDYEGYARTVREAAARVDPSARYVLGGAPFSVVGLAKRMLAHARTGEDSSRTCFERMVFEANTGISCRSFYTDEATPRFRSLTAMAILEDFLDARGTADFVDGQRYFFGHPVPA